MLFVYQIFQQAVNNAASTQVALDLKIGKLRLDRGAIEFTPNSA